MSDHEFEKKMQQKMDDLRLRPSDAVWAEVERNLRREKRRRRLVLWIPLMGVLLTAGGFFIYNGSGNPDKGTVVKKEAVEKTATPSVSTLPSASSAPSTSSSPKNITTPSAENSTQPDNKEKTVVTSAPVIKNAITNNRPDRKSVQRTRNNNLPKPKSDDEDNITDNKKPLLPEVKDKKVKEDGPKATTVDSNAIVSNDHNIDTDLVQDLVDSALKAMAEQKAIAKTTPKKKQSSASKWQWGVNANIGVANISEGNLFDVLKSVRVDDLTGAQPQFNGIPPTPSPEASPITPGPSYTVGGFVQRKLSKRVSLSAGLQYSLFTVNTRVGERVNSARAVNYGMYNSAITDNYYLGGTGGTRLHDYTNRYHFIELPVMTSIHILGKKKMPIVLDAGISVSRLLHTNSLHFDGLNGVYYENDDFFNKMQVSVNGGLNIGLFQNSRHPLFIGPNLRYFTTGIIKKEVTASGGEQHIWSFGLNAKMLLKK
jgi:hypothetical protein